MTRLLLAFLLTLSASTAQAQETPLSFRDAIDRFNNLFEVHDPNDGRRTRITVGSQDKFNITLEWGAFQVNQDSTTASLSVIRTENRRDKEGTPHKNSFGEPIPMVTLLPAEIRPDETGSMSRLMLYVGLPNESSRDLFSFGPKGVEWRDSHITPTDKAKFGSPNVQLAVNIQRVAPDARGRTTYRIITDRYDLTDELADSLLVKDMATGAVKRDSNGFLIYRAVRVADIPELKEKGQLKQSTHAKIGPPHEDVTWQQVWPQ